MNDVAIDTISENLRGFYVPQFEVKIEGAGLPDDVLRDVIEVTYSDNIDELDSFQISVNNWDEAERRFKYIGSETKQDLRQGDNTSNRYTLFEPCNKEVKLSMGYVANMTLMMTGTFVTMEPAFSNSGPPVLTVRALNVLHQLRRKKYDDAYENKKDSEIAETIAARRDRRLRARRFPLEIRTNPTAKNREEPIRFVAQKKEYDIDFLWKRARKKGYVVLIEEETDQHPRRLYFGPSEDPDSRVSYELKWGQSLIDFKPRLTTANQFKSVTVNGWNRSRQRAISVTVDFTDRELNRLNRDLHDMVRKCDPHEEYVVDEPVFTEREARDRARALLLDQHKQMVKVSATTVGLPKLRAGSKVEIGNIGSRLSGTYFVTRTEHVINDSGYITKFNARRENEAQGAA
jgi:Bacteriophage probable baseplate hub protein